MRAEFDQNDLEQGYARITLCFENGDKPYAAGDSIALGRAIGGDNWKYIGKKGDKVWTGAPQALVMQTQPEVSENCVKFILHPAYVDMMEDGIYTVKLLDGDGKVKDQTTLPAYDISWSGLDNTAALLDYQELEEKQRSEAAARKAAEEAAAQKAAEEAAARRAAEEAAARKAAEEAAAKKAAEEAAAQKAAEEAAAQKAAEEAAAKKAAEEAAAQKAAEEAAAKKAAEEAAAKKAAEEAAAQKAAEEAAAKKAAEEAAAKKAAEEAAAKKAAEEAATVSNEVSGGAARAESKGKRWIILGLVLLIVALACAGGYKWYSQKAEQDRMEEAAKAEADRKAAEEAARKAARADAKNRVAAFFAGQRDPKAAMRLADDLDVDTPEQQDAVFRLYYYAAGQDDPQAALKYAQIMDPSLPAWGSIKKDGAEAWYNYAKSPDGEAARQNLKKWAQDAAAGGDAQARAWLERMK